MRPERQSLRRLAGCVITGLALLLTACNGDPPDEVTPSVNQPGSAVQPRAVVQMGHGAPISAVAWVNDGRNLVSIDSSGLILLWEVEQRLILDRIETALGDGWMIFHSLRAQTEPGRVALTYAFTDSEENMPAGSLDECPEAARHENGWCTFSLDLATREFVPDPSVAVPDRPWINVATAPPEVDFPASPDGRWRPEAFRLVDRPELVHPEPGVVHVPEPDEFPGFDCASYTRCDYGIVLNPPNSRERPLALVGESRVYVSDLDISPDGHSMVQIESYHTSVRSWSWVRSTDMLLFRPETAIENEQDYHTVSWFDDRRFAMLGRGFADLSDRNSDELETGAAFRAMTPEQWDEVVEEHEVRDRDPFPPTRLVERNCQQSGRCPAAPAYYAMEPLNDRGDYLGAGNLADCEMSLGFPLCERRMAGGVPIPELLQLEPMSDGISRFDAARGTWRRMTQPHWGMEDIWAIRLSPDRSRLAVLTREGSPQESAAPTLRLRLFAIAGNRLEQLGEPLLEQSYAGSADYGRMFLNGGNPVDPPPGLRFTPDGRRIVFSHYLRQVIDTQPDAYELVVVEADGSAPARHHTGHSQNFVPLTADRVFEVESGKIVDLMSGEVLAEVADRPELLHAGVIAPSKLIWGAGTDGRVQFWDMATGALELTLYMLPDNRFFAMTPGGRYDTNLGPDSRAMRWSVLDQPWHSFAPQTFMRDFYEPGLYARLLDCRAQDECDAAFRPLPPFDEVNRALPTVEIVEIRPARDPAQVVVTVEARSVEGSGIYNLRLFRNGRLVASTPDRLEDLPTGARSWQGTVARWQRANALGEGDSFRTSFTVPLPTDGARLEQVFTAYAFNEDRIKSETATRSYTIDPQDITARPRRAYVITIGLDGYADADLQLNYAVADAELLARQLARVPGYETRELSLLARRRETSPGVTREDVLAVLQLLAGTGERAALLAALADHGIDATLIEAATPDDLVIITYSGHGWTDSIGNFFLVPTDGRTSGERGDLDRLVSAADISHALRTNQAGEIALVLDACFSSAVVSRDSFKPGPLGDAGLGQLAYDKGLLILAASQADNYAVEDASLAHGLLTYALAGPGEGLALPGPADSDGDGRIRLGEWLAYAEHRLPLLSADRRISRFDARRGAPTALARATTQEDYIQRPTLFDFNPAPVRVPVRAD